VVETLGGVHPPSTDVIGTSVTYSSVAVVVLGVVQSESVVGGVVSGTVVVVNSSVVEVGNEVVVHSVVVDVVPGVVQSGSVVVGSVSTTVVVVNSSVVAVGNANVNALNCSKIKNFISEFGFRDL
jgi:hypothetical protein